MTPEEYQRLKEAEKEHLRSLRKLKQAVQAAQRQQKLTDAVRKAVISPMDALENHDALVQELALETARNEARLDVALESVSGGQTEAERVEDEEAMRKARAAQLVRQLRGQVEGASKPAATDSKPGTESTEMAPPPPLPEKTIGRMKP